MGIKNITCSQPALSLFIVTAPPTGKGTRQKSCVVLQDQASWKISITSLRHGEDFPVVAGSRHSQLIRKTLDPLGLYKLIGNSVAIKSNYDTEVPTPYRGADHWRDTMICPRRNSTGWAK
jgi:hypothetical protein